MQNKQYKKLQRKINKAIRNLNENIANDDLWRGRFYARQKDIRFNTYEDKSGVFAAVEILLIDKETDVVHSVVFNKYDTIGVFTTKFSLYGFSLWEEMNKFVCNETRGLSFREYRKNAIDYTSDRRWSR